MKSFDIKRSLPPIKTLIIVFSVIFAIPINPSTAQQQIVKKWHLNGGWYPQTRQELTHLLTDYSKKASTTYQATINPKAVRAIIVPHAGYQYSGVVATSVYRLIERKDISNILLLAPDHASSFTGIAYPSFNKYQIPSGTITVATTSIAKLKNREPFIERNEPFAQEHSAEVQLPFIHHFFQKNSGIIPLLVGQIDCEKAKKAAQILAPLITPSTLVIVSTDFVHYGKRFNFTPFKNAITERIRKLNSEAIEIIQSGACEEFEKFLEKTGATICGSGPLKVLLALKEFGALGNVEPRLIAYDTSASSGTEEPESSVSYVGMLFTQEKLASLPIEQKLTQEEQRELLQEATDVLQNAFDKNVSEELLYPIKSYGLQQQLGVFTTLKTNDNKNELRGCIGRITSSEPLYKTVARTTLDAAFNDSRFSPLKKSELPQLSLSISILSPLKRIKNYQEIRLGKDGIVLENGGRSALFLPEVATEFGWSLPETLTQLSQKAGLANDAWKDKKTTYHVFETDEFTRKKLFFYEQKELDEKKNNN